MDSVRASRRLSTDTLVFLVLPVVVVSPCRRTSFSLSTTSVLVWSQLRFESSEVQEILRHVTCEIITYNTVAGQCPTEPQSGSPPACKHIILKVKFPTGTIHKTGISWPFTSRTAHYQSYSNCHPDLAFSDWVYNPRYCTWQYSSQCCSIGSAGGLLSPNAPRDSNIVHPPG
jgi:hypothetical protein